MKSHDADRHDLEEAFSPRNVYTPQWMLPVLREALHHESEADYGEPPHEAHHHHISLVHHRHR
jgi:hypothetical protein